MKIYHVPCLMLEVIAVLFGDELYVKIRLVECRSSMWVLKITPGYSRTVIPVFGYCPTIDPDPPLIILEPRYHMEL